MKFEMTEEAQRIALEHLSNDGSLMVRITRVGRNEFEVGLYKDDVMMLQMEGFSLEKGDSFVLSGISADIKVRG